MSWWLMHEKNKREEKVQALRDYFKRYVDMQYMHWSFWTKQVLFFSMDKNDDDKITKEDWLEALSKHGAKVSM